MNIIEKLAEKYAWVIDAYVWFNVIGTIVGLAIFVVVGVCMLRGFRRIKSEREDFEERRRCSKQRHEEIRNRIRQNRQDFDDWR